jgi:hypothetical protein
LVVGLDIGKRKHHAFFGNGNGKTILKGLIVENSAEGFHHLLSQVDFYMQRGGFKSVAFGLEPTSVYHKPLAEHLIERGHLVVYATNEAIKKNRSLIDGRWDKHDTKDSANVADLVAQGKCHYYDLPELRLRDLRSLLLLRKRLKKQFHGCRVRIRNNLLAQYFPELDLFWNHADAESLAIVREYLDPARIRQLSCEQFIARVITHNGGLRQRRRLRQIWEAAGAGDAVGGGAFGGHAAVHQAATGSCRTGDPGVGRGLPGIWLPVKHSRLRAVCLRHDLGRNRQPPPI